MGRGTGPLMWLNSDPFSTWREAGWRQGSLIKAEKKKKKAEGEEEDAGGAPHAGCCDLCWARSCSSHPPTMTRKQEIPWEKKKKIYVPDKKYRQNNVSYYRVAFFSPQEIGGSFWWATSIWFTVPFHWGSSKSLQCNWELRTAFIYSLIAS